MINSKDFRFVLGIINIRKWTKVITKKRKVSTCVLKKLHGRKDQLRIGTSTLSKMIVKMSHIYLEISELVFILRFTL